MGRLSRGATGDSIPIQTRMMTISDIYDALTAADRPYKAAVASARALDIMSGRFGCGQLDASLFGLCRRGEVFDRHDQCEAHVPATTARPRAAKTRRTRGAARSDIPPATFAPRNTPTNRPSAIRIA